ncbi:MAG: hypothetical protein ACKOB4_12690 [Acidobacteriota bacterium]
MSTSRSPRHRGGTVIVLAGRRIDPTDNDHPRFPLSRVGPVRDEIRRVLAAEQVALLVTAAACGADLLALHVAGELGARRRVVLPAHPARFRINSVIDRPGDWEAIYDRAIADVAQNGDLVIVDHGRTSADDDYLQTNLDLLDEANRLAVGLELPLRAVVVWDGRSRGPDDVTAHFLAEARKRAIPVIEILTMGRPS